MRIKLIPILTLSSGSINTLYKYDIFIVCTTTLIVKKKKCLIFCLITYILVFPQILNQSRLTSKNHCKTNTTLLLRDFVRI